MAKEIDERVVSMQFDNSRFESNASKTMGTLAKLKESLNFGKSAKSLEDVNTAANSMNLSGISSAIDNINSKFNAMGAIAFSVIASITSMALNAGLSIAKSLTIQPMIDGLREYETNMNSIQTILANTKSEGSNLQDVNNALDQLNEYSDQTIYNFSQMARNIGTFTAAGVGLQESVNAIKGIANLAAISGSSSEQASTAMYQLSQALAAGKVNLMDWNSVVNAGMGGEVFKKALFETGKALNTINNVPLGATFEEWEKAGGTFREQMQSGWLTSDVLSTTLEAFSGDLDTASLKALGFSDAAAQQMIELGKLGIESATRVKTATQLMSTIRETVGSGWAQTFRIIIGDFEEAPKLFTSINNVVGGFANKMAEARNFLFEGWSAGGGRDIAIEGIKNALTALWDILKRVGLAFREVFPAMTVDRLFALTTQFRDFTAKLKPSEQTLDKIRVLFRGIFSGFAIGVAVVKEIANAFGTLFSSFAKTNGGNLLSFFASITQKITNLKTVLIDNGGLSKFFDTFVNPLMEFIGNLNITGALDSLIGIFVSLKEAVLGFFANDEISEGSENIANAADRVADRFGWLSTVVEKLGELGDWLRGKIDKIADVFRGLLGKIAEVFSGTDTDAVFDAVNVGLLGGLLLVFKKFVDNGLKLDFGGGFMEGVKDALGGLTDTLGAMQANLKAEALQKLAIAIGILVASVLVLSMIDSEALTKAMTAMAVGFGQLVAAMALLTKATTNLKSSAQVTVLAAGLIMLGAAILVLSLAVKVLSSMDAGELAKGLIGVMVLLGGVTLAVNNMPEKGQLIAAGVGMAAMAVGVLIMSMAVKALGSMETGQLIRGLLGVAAAMGILVLAVNNMPEKGKVLSAAVAMVAMGIALNMMALAIAILGNMETGTLVRGLIGVAVAMGIMVAAVNLMPNSVLLLATAVAMVAMGVAINIIAGAVAILGNMDMGALIQGLLGLAGALLIITIAMAGMSGVIVGAVGMIIAAAAITILAAALTVMSNLGIGNILMALLGVAAALAVITIAAALMQPFIPAIFALGSALIALGIGGALFGVAAILIAAAITLIVGAIGELIEIGVEGAKVFAETLPIVAVAIADAMIQIGNSLAEALPGIITKLGEALGALLQVLIDNLPKFGELMSELIQTMLKVLNDNVPDIVAAGFNLIMALLQGISDNIEEITNTVIDIITKFLGVLAERADEIAAGGLAVLAAFLQGIADNIQLVIDAAGNIIISIVTGIANKATEIVAAGKDMVIKFLEGLGQAGIEIGAAITTLISTMLEEAGKNWLIILAAGVQFVTTFLRGITGATSVIAEEIGKFVTSALEEIGKLWLTILAAGVEFAKTFLQGIVGAATELAEAAFDFITNLLDSLADVIDRRSDEVREKGANLARAILEGLTGIDLSELVEWAKGLATRVIDEVKSWFGIKSPSKVFMKIGDALVEGMAIGMSNTRPAEQAGTALASGVYNAVQSAYKYIETMPEYQPVITPVLDLSNVTAGAKALNSIVTTPKIDATLSYGQASALVDMTSAQDVDAGDKEASPTKEIVFTQINHSPEALTTQEIYRQTKAGLMLVQDAILK